MTVSETMVKKAAQAMIARQMDAEIVGCCASWEDIARAALTAALSDQVVVPKEPTEEMLDNAFVNGPLGMTGLDGSKQAKRERATVAEIYRAMIAAAPPPSSTAGEGK